MDRDKDAKLTYEEFVEGSKQDPTIVQVPRPHFRDARILLNRNYLPESFKALSLYDGLV
jgi:hypothetical protein